MPDGIHWTQDAVRLQLNIILTHFCLSRDIKLPGRLIKNLFRHFVNFYPRWGGERNRPLESAKKIADAATADEKEHKDGPATKRRRVQQETSSDFHHEEMADIYPIITD